MRSCFSFSLFYSYFYHYDYFFFFLKISQAASLLPGTSGFIGFGNNNALNAIISNQSSSPSTPKEESIIDVPSEFEV